MTDPDRFGPIDEDRVGPVDLLDGGRPSLVSGQLNRRKQSPVDTLAERRREKAAPLAAEYDVLQIGCGDYQPDGWLNTDVSTTCDPDFTLDAGADWPFPDNSFRMVHARHVLEHLSHGSLTDTVIPEAGRVLRSGGRLKIVVPIGADAIADPTHRSRWGWRTPAFYARSAAHWQPGSELPFRLAYRSLDLWFHNPLDRASWLLNRAADRWPVAMSRAPFASGELTAIFERVEEDG